MFRKLLGLLVRFLLFSPFTFSKNADIKLDVAADPKQFLAMIESAVKRVIQAEPEITRFDTIAGDGDAGKFEFSSIFTIKR